jgi:hypothetical protein
MTRERLRLAARVSGAICVVLAVLACFPRANRVFPNEYGVPDGAIAAMLGLPLLQRVGLATRQGLPAGPRGCDRGLDELLGGVAGVT